MSDWIVRVLPLPVRDPFVDPDPLRAELARFRLRIIPPHERPGQRALNRRQQAIDVGPVRILALDSANPHGGVGGSLDSEQCAWLVRELDRHRDRYLVVVTHDGARTLMNRTVPDSRAARVLGAEVISILLANPSVVAWVSGTMHERAGRRHGSAAHGFWEIPGAAVGRGAPLAGGLSVWSEVRHLHRAIVLRGALAGGAGASWELKDPLPEPTAARSASPAPVGDNALHGQD